MIQIHASYHRLTTDSEGESTLTLKIPASDLAKASTLPTLKQKVLLLTIEEQDSK